MKNNMGSYFAKTVLAIKSKLYLKISLPLMAVTFLALVFQNCGKVDFDTRTSNNTNCTSVNCQQIAAGIGSCSFNGVEVAHQQTVTAFQNSSVGAGQACVSEVRSCNNGALSGSYQYASCTPQGPRSCLFNGQTIASGQSITAFVNSMAAVGSTCTSESRTCSDGTLSGSYQYGTCSVATTTSCLFNGQTISSGSSAIAFQNSTVAMGQTCVSENRVCTGGVLSGSFSYASCAVSTLASCLFNGASVASGQAVTAFQNSTVPYGQTCSSENRLCTDGTLSGTYANPTCSVGAAASCTFNGQSVASGQTVTAFQNSSVGIGQNCVSETRVCSNGSLVRYIHFRKLCACGSSVMYIQRSNNRFWFDDDGLSKLDCAFWANLCGANTYLHERFFVGDV